MNQEPEQPSGNDDPLQFDHADYGETKDQTAGVTCAACAQPVHDMYYEINGKAACAGCRQKIQEVLCRGSRFGRLVRALLAGTGAGLIGAGIYFGVAAISGYEIGLIALLVGVLVGGAVRWGSRARGGWFYQTLAVFMTYAAISLSYSFSALKAIAEDPDSFKSGFTTSVPSTEPATTAPASQAAAASNDDPSSSSPEEPVNPAAAALYLLIAAVVLGCFALALPIMVAIESPISLLIVGIALYEAWKINRCHPPQISGPYSVGPHQAPAEVGSSAGSTHG